MYCISCGENNHEGSARCIRCGHDLGSLREGQFKKAQLDSSSIALWNPDVAALLSLLFSPAFGAIIHALNWLRLGQRRRATNAWLWALFILVAKVVYSIYAMNANSDKLTWSDGYKLMQFVMIILWYFCAARSQGQYIAREMRGGYRRESWFIPVCIAIIMFGSLGVLADSLE